VNKLAEKVSKLTCLKLVGTQDLCENWVVARQQYLTNFCFQSLEKANMNHIPTFTDEHNIKLNSASGLW
jgi:hypothetical protein